MDVEFCQKLFLNLLRWSCNFYSSFVNVVYHTDWFVISHKSNIEKNPCIPGINPTLSRCVILLSIFEFALLTCCWGFFHLCSSLILAYNFLFCDIFVCFSYQGDAGLIEWVWEHSFLCKFWEYLRRISVKSSLNIWYNSSVKPSVPGLLFAWSVFITDSTSLLLIGLFIFSISFWFRLEILHIPRILFISSRSSISFAYNRSQ